MKVIRVMSVFHCMLVEKICKMHATSFLLMLLAASGLTQKDVIRQYDFQNDGSGNYSFHVETGAEKGVKASFIHQQQGHSPNKASDNGSLRVDGRILYKVDDSLSLDVTYTADENGYRPKIKWVFVPKKQRPQEPIEIDLRGPDQKSGISGTVLGTLIGGNGK